MSIDYTLVDSDIQSTDISRLTKASFNKDLDGLVSQRVSMTTPPVQLNFTGGINPTGPYNELTSYSTGDSVSYLGGSYVAIQATTGNLPTNDLYWQLLAEKGNVGASIISSAFSGNDILFGKDDYTTVTLTNAKIDLKGDKGDTGATPVSASFVGNDMIFLKDDASLITITGAKTALKGDQGEQGEQGIQGIPGTSGDHETLSNLSGGATNEYYHLTQSQHTTATREASALQSGILSSSDWSNFNSKVSSVDFSTVSYPASQKIGNPTTIDSLQELFNHQFSSGVMYSCDYTDNGNGSITIGTGSAIIRNADNETAPLMICEVSSPQVLTLLEGENYIYLDYNSGSPVFNKTNDKSVVNCWDKCLAFYGYRKNTTINLIDARKQNVDIIKKIKELFFNFAKFIPSDQGSILSESSTPLTFAVTSGKFYFMVQSIPHEAFDTSISGLDFKNNFTLCYQDGAGDFYRNTNQKTIDTTKYDNNTGSLSTLNNNKFGAVYFFILNNDPSMLYAVYSQQEFANSTDASASLPPTNLPIELIVLGSYIGFCYFEKSATTVATTIVNAGRGQSYAAGISINHEDLVGLQGGAIGDHVHLTADEASSLVMTQFETISKNLKSYSFSLADDLDGNLSTVTYSNGIVKTLNYTDGVLTSVTLSGSVPSGINLTKTLIYSAGKMIGASYG